MYALQRDVLLPGHGGHFIDDQLSVIAADEKMNLVHHISWTEDVDFMYDNKLAPSPVRILRQLRVTKY